MRRRIIIAISALLTLLVCISACAEGVMPPEGVELESEQVDPAVEELGEIDLFTGGAEQPKGEAVGGGEPPEAPVAVPEDVREDAQTEPAPQTSTVPGEVEQPEGEAPDEGSELGFAVMASEPALEGAPEATPEAAQEDAQTEPEPQATVAPDDAGEPEPLVIFGDAMEPRIINLKKKATRTVYIGVPYQIKVSGKAVKKCKSASKKIARVTNSGLLTPKKKGKTKITVKSGKKTIVLTVNVKKSPAPQSLKASASNGSFALSWGAAKVSTGYLVQISEDSKNWEDYKVLTETSLDITPAATGTRYFRVKTILGDHFGGCSGVVSILKPVTKIKVVCEEAALSGPTDKLNITWSGTVGATAYEVYRAVLPSEDYQLIGTTTKTYYADRRTATTLYSYRVRAIFGEVKTALSAPANLWTGVQTNVLPPANITSSTGIVLLVNKKAQVVTAYVKDASGKYTIPLRHMLCSTGRVYGRTKNGTYKLKARKGEWYRYPSGVYIRYPSIYRDGYYFHSPLYNANKTIRSSTVYKLGSRQSLGCVRLKVRDAEWVYKHCKTGTTVYICDGKNRSSLRKAIKPRNVKVKGF